MKQKRSLTIFLFILLLLLAGCSNQSDNETISPLQTDETGQGTSSSENMPSGFPENMPDGFKGKKPGDATLDFPDAVSDDPAFSEDGTDSGTASITDIPLLDFDAVAVVNDSVQISADAEIQLNGSSVSINGSGVTADGQIVTISEAGTYVLSGTLTDGQILVNTTQEAKVRLILNGVDIKCSNSAPIYIISSPKKTELVLPEGSVNRLEDGSEYLLSSDETADNPSAAIYSKDDLEIEGMGSLYVTGHYNKGIFSKDDLEIKGGSLYITAVDDGIRGKDSVVISAGDITVSAGGDGIRTSNETDSTKGYIDISGGTINITAALDGIQAITDLNISGGELTISSGGGSVNSSKSSGNDWRNWGGGGKGGFRGWDKQTTETADTASAKGIKAGTAINLSGGTISIDSSDDALHSNNSVTLDGSNLTILSGDDGIHADDTLNINQGDITINKSYEGIEAVHINISGGNIRITASDDGINAAGGVDASSTTNRTTGRGMGMFSETTGDAAFTGGTVTIDAAGDGIDVNGSVTMTGGTYIVHGPTNNGNGALDYDGSFTVNGGTLIALGSSGMAQSVTSTTQGVLSFTSSLSVGALIHIEDEDGNDMLTINTVKQTGCIVYTDPALESKKEYSVYIDGTLRGTLTTK